MNIPFSAYDFFGYLANGFVILCATEYALFGTAIAERDWKVGAAIFYLVLAYIIGHIVANVSSYLLEHIVVRAWLKSPEETLFKAQQRTWRARFFPIFFQPFPERTQKRVLDAAKRHGFEEPGRALFFHAHAVAKQDKTTQERLTSFLNLYGFCRNVSLGLLLAAVILVAGALLDWGKSGIWSDVDNLKVAWAGAALVGAIGMFYRYLKFFRHYTIEVFNTYAELKAEKPKETIPIQVGS
jgi:hypothetical protein